MRSNDLEVIKGGAARERGLPRSGIYVRHAPTYAPNGVRYPPFRAYVCTHSCPVSHERARQGSKRVGCSTVSAQRVDGQSAWRPVPGPSLPRGLSGEISRSFLPSGTRRQAQPGVLPIRRTHPRRALKPVRRHQVCRSVRPWRQYENGVDTAKRRPGGSPDA